VDDKRISIDQLREQQRQNWPEAYNSSRPAVLRILRAADEFLNQSRIMNSEHNLQGPDFDVLLALRRQQRPFRVTPTELCRALLISSGGLTKVLNRLEQAGLIERPANPSDGRSKLVQLTAKGQTLAETVIKQVSDLHAQRLSRLSADEEATLDALLKKMLDTAPAAGD